MVWDRRVAVGVVIAAAGYPGEPRKGDAIIGLPQAEEDLHVFHAATARNADRIVTNICFGGPDLKTAYITCSETGRLIACDWPRPGLKLAFG